ncbi:MAG: ISNCY family transposase [Deltaproteobacteria bacterium]|nr:ISNCY family transposase [Deltaproteobacteria bacterium]
MRKKKEPQLNLLNLMPRNKIAQELEAIAHLLDANQDILDLVYCDLVKYRRQDTGRNGMTAEQVLRCAILKQYRELTYEELAFHLDDSQAFRSFARLEMGQYPSDSTLQDNISAIGAETWEAVNRALLRFAAQQDIEKGRTVRVDSTVVETHIHHPTDSTLLADGIRVTTRLLQEGRTLNPAPWYTFVDHQRAAKKRVLRILNAKKDKVRLTAYLELLSLAHRVRGYALQAITELKGFVGADLQQTIAAHILLERLERAVSLLKQVLDQTGRRIIRGEKVPAGEKVVSFFECHTDVIVKDGRNTQYGHKVFLSGGRSGLILDCTIERGNPADAAMFPTLLDRQRAIFQRPPRQLAADGGFASKENLRLAKGQGVKDVMFAKRRGLGVLDMVKSLWVYKKLRNFLAGIEANISRLKRAFGLDRCNWQGWPGFQQYVWSAVVSYNVLVLGLLLRAQ